MSFATTPVQPVWWEAPSPSPLSPWKYSWNWIRSRQCGSLWNFSRAPLTGRRPSLSFVNSVISRRVISVVTSHNVASCCEPVGSGTRNVSPRQASCFCSASISR